MSKKSNSWLTTGLVVAGILAVGVKFKEQLLTYADKIGIGEYLR